MIDGVVFDLDGVLLQTEELWDEVREAFARERGGRYGTEAQRPMMGMSSIEWSRYMHEVVGVRDAPEAISDEVVRRMSDRYRARLPLIPGALAAVERMAARWPLALASSSNRPLIDLALELGGLDRYFRTTVSSEEVPRGKPSPDVYLEAARRLGGAPERCVAVEDSAPGIHSAADAGLAVIAVPNAGYPPGADALERAAGVLDSLQDLTPTVVEAARPQARLG